MGHGIFEAPAWIHAERRASLPGLFDVPDSGARRRVMRTTTPNESHFAATYPPGSKEFFQEARANEFMGSLLTPRRLLSRQFAVRCEALGLRPADFITRARTLLASAAWPTDDNLAPRQGNLGFLNMHKLALEQVLLLLACDFGVTRRFIKVRLKKYELLPRELTV
jgi:hypothetical protein